MARKFGIGCANYSVYRSIGTPNVVLGGGGGGVWLGGADLWGMPYLQKNAAVTGR